MGRNKGLDKEKLLNQLEKIEYREEDDVKESTLEQMSLALSLLKLAEINHESEYGLCQAVASHLLEKVPEPDDLELEAE